MKEETLKEIEHGRHIFVYALKIKRGKIVMDELLTALITSVSTLVAVYLGAILTSRSADRKQRLNEYQYVVSVLMDTLGNFKQYVKNEFIKPYEDLKRQPREARDMAMELELSLRAQKIGQSGGEPYINLYKGYRKSKELDFLGDEFVLPLTANHSLNELFFKLYTHILSLRRISRGDRFSDEITEVCKVILADVELLEQEIHKRYGGFDCAIS